MKKLLLEREVRKHLKKLVPILEKYGRIIPEEALTFQQKNSLDFLVEHGFFRERSEDERLCLEILIDDLYGDGE